MGKKLLIGTVFLTASLIVGQTTFARDNSLVDYERGFLIGAQAGYARVNPGDIEAILNTSVSTKGIFGGRLYMGYSFTPYFSIDTGYAFYRGDKYANNVRINVHAVDLLAKAILPLENLSPSLTGWSLYGKLGPIATLTRVKGNDQLVQLAGRSDVALFAVKPGYALGLGYNFTDNFGIDLSWSGIYGDKINKKSTVKSTIEELKKFRVPAVNLIALGVSYKF